MFAATSRCGNRASSWNIRPMPRRCGGTPARSSGRRARQSRRRAAGAQRSPAAASTCRCRSGRARRRVSPSSTVEVDAGERRVAAEHDPERPANAQHQSLARRVGEPLGRRAPRRPVIAARSDGERRGEALVRLSGPAEEPEDRHGQRWLLGAGDEDGGAELAEGDCEREAGCDGERATSERDVDLSPGRRGGARRALPPPRASRGSIERSAGVTMRTTNGAATSDCATGTSHQDDLKSSGASSNAIRKPNPSITAEAPSGSSTRPSSAPGGRRASATAASPPTTSAIAAATLANATE